MSQCFSMYKCKIACLLCATLFLLLRLYHAFFIVEGTMIPPRSLSLLMDLPPSIASSSNTSNSNSPLSSLIEKKVFDHSTTSTNNTSMQLTGKHLDYVDSLLDFAIIGFPKTSTSFHITWMSRHPEIHASHREVYFLRDGDPAGLVQLLHKNLTYAHGRKVYKQGYKAPTDIQQPQTLKIIRKYFPSAHLFVGLRHPVRWFESFYNFRVRHGRKMPPPNELSSSCGPESCGVCGEAGAFHIYLSRLGKTFINRSHYDLADQSKLLGIPRDQLSSSRFPPLSNKVFLYDIEQLRDLNTTRRDIYRQDVSRFLGLTDDLEPFHEDNPKASHRKTKFAPFSICEDQYRPLRRALLDMGRSSSLWIRRHFLPNDEVYVSSADYFNDLLLDWMKDPCENPKTNDDILMRN